MDNIYKELIESGYEIKYGIIQKGEYYVKDNIYYIWNGNYAPEKNGVEKHLQPVKTPTEFLTAQNYK